MLKKFREYSPDLHINVLFPKRIYQTNTKIKDNNNHLDSNLVIDLIIIDLIIINLMVINLIIIGPIVIRTKGAKNQILFLKILILTKDPSKMGINWHVLNMVNLVIL